MSSKARYITGLFDDDDILIKGVKELKSNDLQIKEVFTPFPVHGLDKAMGLAPTRMAIAAFMYGLTGLCLAMIMMGYMMIGDWPQIIGGKPNFSFISNMPSFVPIMFELTVFCAAHLMVLTFFIRGQYFPGAKAKNPDPRTTDDKFLVEVLTFTSEEEEKALNILKSNGAIEISDIKEEV